MLLEVANLTTHLFTRQGVIRAVEGVNLELDRGRTLGLVGESGCGKSMTALSIAGLLPTPPARIIEGAIRLDGRDLVPLDERALEEVRGREVGVILQDPLTSLNPTVKVGVQIGETLIRHFGISRAEARAQSLDLLDQVRLPRAVTLFDQYPHELSGGMRQRVMIAIAVSCHPKLLIADEPVTALDVTTQGQILDLMAELQAASGMAMIVITHDMGVVARVADEVAVMYAGQIVESAPTRTLLEHPEHPYTEALLGSRPRMSSSASRSARLVAIAGAPPSLLHPPAACRFAPRCQWADDLCSSTAPELRLIRPGHWVRTYHPSSVRVHGRR